MGYRDDKFAAKRSTAVQLQVTVGMGHGQERNVSVWWKPRGREYGMSDLMRRDTYAELFTVDDRTACISAAIHLLEEILSDEYYASLK